MTKSGPGLSNTYYCENGLLVMFWNLSNVFEFGI